MQNIIVDEPTSAEETEAIKAKVYKMFDEVRKIKEKMDSDQKDIERMKIHTRAMLDELEKAA